jgi:hypothetical protein
MPFTSTDLIDAAIDAADGAVGILPAQIFGYIVRDMFFIASSGKEN